MWCCGKFHGVPILGMIFTRFFAFAYNSGIQYVWWLNVYFNEGKQYYKVGAISDPKNTSL